MPVIQLRTPADYFGINEAPQQPLFQASQSVDPDIAFHRQMVGLRQQRPLAQAQAIQNQYSTIFNNAEKLRLEQQAAKEAEQAVSALAGLTPEVDDYITQRQEIQRQFPNAMLDPRVQRIVDDNDRMFSSRQAAIAKQQEDMMKRREELQVMGVPPDMAEKAAQSRDATAQLKFQYGKGSAKDITGQAMKEDLELLESSIKDMVDEGTNEIQNKDGTFSPSPEFQRLTEERKRLRDELRGFYQGKYRPATTEPAAKETEKVVTPPSPTSFMDTMKKGATQAPTGEGAVPSLTLQEEIEDINSIADDPNALIEAVRSGNRSAEAKKVALEKLKEFQKKLPTFEFKTGTPEQISDIKRNISGLVEEAKSEIELEPFRQEVNKAWTTEKKNMQSQIKDFAKALGVSPDLAESWLAQNVTYTTEFDPTSDAMPRKIAIRDYFDEYLQNRVGKSLRDEADIISRLSSNKYADKLGIGKSKLAKGLVSQVLAPFIGPFAYSDEVNIAPSKGPTYGRMLDAYLGEKFPNQGDNQGQPTSAVANITTEAEFDALPIGAKFRFGDGEIRTKERERKK